MERRGMRGTTALMTPDELILLSISFRRGILPFTFKVPFQVSSYWSSVTSSCGCLAKDTRIVRSRGRIG